MESHNPQRRFGYYADALCSVFFSSLARVRVFACVCVNANTDTHTHSRQSGCRTIPNRPKWYMAGSSIIRRNAIVSDMRCGGVWYSLAVCSAPAIWRVINLCLFRSHNWEACVCVLACVCRSATVSAMCRRWFCGATMRFFRESERARNGGGFDPVAADRKRSATCARPARTNFESYFDEGV